jgi:hypothetical protein
MNFQTPPEICKYMVSLVPNGCKTILEPTPGEGNIVKELGNYNVTAPEDFFQLSSSIFDCIVMNPPFTPMKLGYKILYRCMEMSNNIIALMPWLVLINSTKRTSDIINFGLKSITHLPRNVFKGSRVQTCILQMQKGYFGDISFKNYLKL